MAIPPMPPVPIWTYFFAAAAFSTALFLGPKMERFQQRHQHPHIVQAVKLHVHRKHKVTTLSSPLSQPPVANK